MLECVRQSESVAGSFFELSDFECFELSDFECFELSDFECCHWRMAAAAFTVIGARDDEDMYTDVVDYIITKIKEEGGKTKSLKTNTLLSVEETKKLVEEKKMEELAGKMMELIGMAAEEVMSTTTEEEGKKGQHQGQGAEIEACVAVLAFIINGLDREKSVEMTVKAAKVVVVNVKQEQQCVGALLCLLNASPYDEAKLAVLTILVTYGSP